MRRAWLASLLAVAALLAAAGLSWAADAGKDAAAMPDAVASGSDAGDPDAVTDAPLQIWSSCIEHVPSEASRPKLTEEFPERGLAGHAMVLRVSVEHGKGETVFPAGLQIQADAARALAESGLVVPSPDGGSGPSITTRAVGDHAATDVVISFVALPPKPGRHVLMLPPLPITLARASGEIVTVCTMPHRVVVDDPIANEPEPMPKLNPPPRHQRELWTLARDVSYGLLVGAVIAAVATWLILRWLRRPRPLPPPPPPRPPWETALSELAELRGAGLVAAGQMTELIDRASDIVRRYLGQLYGFDGIESTTDEVLQSLRSRVLDKTTALAVAQLLSWSDLVKFARVAPTPDDCTRVLDESEQVVRSTIPQVAAPPTPPAPPSAATPSAPAAPTAPETPPEPPQTPPPPAPKRQES